ncbi:MAG: Ku protein [bacterium]|nr:Ku protein [bacterium]
MRALWIGTLELGLVNIPVRLYPATKERKLSFDLLRKGDLCPVGYVRVCKTTGEEVPHQEIVRGYEYEPGNYVVLTNEDFEKADLKRNHVIEILHFTQESEIENKYFEKPFYLSPDEGGDQMFNLLKEAMLKAKKVAIAQFVLKNQEYLGVLKAENDLLLFDQIRFVEEIKNTFGLPKPRDEPISEDDLHLVLRLIEKMSKPFTPEEYKDIYNRSIREVIKEKALGEIVRSKWERPKPTSPSQLKEQLQQSLELVRF